LWLSENQQNKFSPLYKRQGKKEKIGAAPEIPSMVFEEDDIDVSFAFRISSYSL
jgi:hypothetical protein